MSRSRKPVAILHFMPLEGYPPVQNLLNILSNQKEANFFCISTEGAFNFEYKSREIKIFRLGNIAKEAGVWGRLLRYLSYFLYNIGGLFILLLYRPSTVLYYESISAFPAVVFQLMFPTTRLMVHYHEYSTQEEYNSGPFINRVIHKFEVEVYKDAIWISHTNKQRLQFFSKDHNLESQRNLKVIPNYPPLSWQKKRNVNRDNLHRNFVYVGYSLDTKSMYGKEIIDFIAANSTLKLDMYLFKIPKEIKRYADEISSGNIRWYEGVEYNKLPLVLNNYDIGLILYKGLTANYKYNAPNKLFEYLACGLEVWSSHTIKGISPYLDNPAIRAINFSKLDEVNNITATGSVNYEERTSEYYAENALDSLIQELIN